MSKLLKFALFRPGLRYLSLGVTARSSDNLTRVTQEHGVLTITMSNPKKRNALSLEMLENLIDDIIGTEEDPSLRAIVIANDGPVFSAGHDLKELMIEEKQQHIFSTCSVLMSAIRNSPVPIISKVRGLAAAAGCQLVAVSDIAVCTDKSSFSTPGANFGLFCSTPGVALVRAVPRQLANLMLFSGEPINAQQAFQAGLVAKISTDDTLDADVDHIANTIKAKPRDVVALGKKFLYQQIETDVATAFRMGENVMVSNLQYSNAREGLASFAEKRKPKFE